MNLTKEQIVKKLPARPKDANKGTFGKVLVIAGSGHFPGAAYLACAACYRAGAGLVSLATINSVKIIVSKKLPEVTFISFNEVIKRISDYDVLLIGPGLGQGDQAVKLLEQVKRINLPKALIDGDGLNILSKTDNWWEELKGDIVLTPHPGEMARLTKLPISEIQADRINIVQNFSKKWNKIIVLKGANTVISSPDGKILISPFANPILATAGTGDILSGIIAGLLAQGLKVSDASCVGVFIHSLAAEVIAKEIGKTGMLASDLLKVIPKVIKQLKKRNK